MEKSIGVTELEKLQTTARGRRTLSMLGRNQQFINAMNSPVGKEFLRRLVDRVEKHRVAFQKMDIDLSQNKFLEARAKLNESEELLYEFLDVVENQEKILRAAHDSTKGG
jgi:hypothetical protein